MPRLLLRYAALLTAVLAAACGSGDHNTPDEAGQGAAGQDSLTTGTAVPGTLPPAGTVNPAAPSGPATHIDSAAPGVIGQPTSPASGVGPAQPPTPIEKEGDDSPR